MQFRKFYDTDPVETEDLAKKLESTLAMLRRQTQIANMYEETRLVIENTESVQVDLNKAV